MASRDCNGVVMGMAQRNALFSCCRFRGIYSDYSAMSRVTNDDLICGVRTAKKSSQSSKIAQEDLSDIPSPLDHGESESGSLFNIIAARPTPL